MRGRKSSVAPQGAAAIYSTWASIAVLVLLLSGEALAAVGQIDQAALQRILTRMGLDQQQQASVQNQLQQIEQRRAQEIEKRRKEDVQNSLAMIKEAFEKGKKAYQEQRYSAAYLHFMDVASSRLKEAAKMAAEAKEKVLEIEAMALAKLEQAEVLILRGQHAQAAEILTAIVEGFPYCDAARQAKGRLVTLRTMPSVASALRWAEGKAQESAENWAGALKIYDEVAQRWPDELAGLRARVAAEAIRKDPEKMKVVEEALRAEAERSAPTLIAMAKNFVANMENLKLSGGADPKAIDELRSQAAAKLRTVIGDYPGTIYAEEAKALLATLEGADARARAEPGPN